MHEAAIEVLKKEKARLEWAVAANRSEGKYYRDRASKFDSELAELDARVIVLGEAIARLGATK